MQLHVTQDFRFRQTHTVSRRLLELYRFGRHVFVLFMKQRIIREITDAFLLTVALGSTTIAIDA
jgi:NAD-dependent DNA ligase